MSGEIDEPFVTSRRCAYNKQRRTQLGARVERTKGWKTLLRFLPRPFHLPTQTFTLLQNLAQAYPKRPGFVIVVVEWNSAPDTSKRHGRGIGAAG